MGKPINSSGNDLMFRLKEDGQTAVMSSDRKSGEGAYDIYQVFMTLPKPMPPRSKEQLTYVRDYFNKLNPQIAEVEEEKKTHLETLKERLALEEQADNQEEAKTESELELETETVSETETEFETESRTDEVVAGDVQEEQDAEQKLETENPSENELSTEVEAKELSRTEEKEAMLADLLKERKRIEDKIVSERKTTTSQEKITEDDKPKELSDQPVVIEGTKEIEPVVDEPEAPEITNQSEEINTSVTSSPNLTSKKDVAANKSKESNKRTSTNIPQTATNESPLETIRTESKAIETATTVQLISGEKISNALLYQDRQDLLNPVNKEKVEKLKTYLRNNPQHSVHIISHTDHLEPGLPEFMQYNTLKRANLVARYLMENGVARDNISIESVSANYPLAKPVISGQLNREYLGYNKRIEFEILDEDNTILATHNISDSKIPGYALDRKYELYSQIREEVYYSVEIANSEHIFKNAVLRLYDDIYIRRNSPTAKNRYYIGVFNKYEQVLALQQELEKSSAPYAEIKVFYQGQPVSKSNLKLLAKDYPDLNAYLAGQE